MSNNNNYVDDVYNKLERIAKIHKSNQSQFNTIQQNANKEVSKAEKLASDAYAADRAAKDALKKAIESAKIASNFQEIKPNENEIYKLENEIEEKIKIHTEALNNYKKINKETNEIMNYHNPEISKLFNQIQKLIKKIKKLSRQIKDAFINTKNAADKDDKKNFDIYEKLTLDLEEKNKSIKKELDDMVERMKQLTDKESENKKIAQKKEQDAKEFEIKTKLDIENIRIDNTKKINELIANAKIESEKKKVGIIITAKTDAVKAEELEKKRQEAEIRSNLYDFKSKDAEVNADQVAKELLEKNIELWKGIKPEIYSNFQTLNTNLVEITDRNILKSFTREVQHPYPELLRGENIKKQTGGSMRGGAIPIKDMINIIDLPNIWSKEHHKMFRELNVLKTLSLNPKSIKEMKLFKGTKSINRCKTLVLMLFWDIQDLIEDCEELKITNLQIYKNLFKNIELNNKTIKEFVDFTYDNTTNKGKTARFVLIEDLIIFYKNFADKYIKNKYENVTYQEFFNNEEEKIFARLITHYKHWFVLNEQFNLLKKNLDVISEEISLKYSLENQEPIKTYLNIRCYTHEKNLYNEYFNIYADPEEKKNNKLESVYVTGPDTNINVPFYTPKKNGEECPHVPANIILNSDCTLKEILEYNYGYLYGPFTRVFLPEVKNKDVSNSCVEILNTLNRNESVCLFGNGTSGSGKTSLLFYNTFTKEDGVILELLNNDFLKVYEIVVSVHEIYANGSKIENIKYSDILFKKDPKNAKEGFILDTSNNGKNGKYTQNNKSVNKETNLIEWKDIECSWKIEDGTFTHSRSDKKITKLNEFIITLINDVRMIRPTPNNRESSRSHLIAYFKIVINGKFVNLVAGDLAGVENKPVCKEEATQKEYLGLKGTGTTPYYVNGDDYKEIEKICNERTAEGLFINNSLYGMRKELENIVKEDLRFSLFSKIPIFNSPCLEYYCNQHSYNCFNLPDINSNTKYENAIFTDIRQKVGLEEKLNIFIFGILNINRDFNNPPKMPYFDLTFFKLKREQLFTNMQYENKSEEITNAVSEIKTYFEGEIKPVLEVFKLSINQLLMDAVYQRYEQFAASDLPLQKVYPVLINLINILEEINSTSVLGTLDFLHTMKNSMKTDISCNIFKLAKNDPDTVLHDIYGYKNIINFNSTKTLHDVLTMQKATIKHKNTSSLIRGGSKISKEKERLLKEFYMLKKLISN